MKGVFLFVKLFFSHPLYQLFVVDLMMFMYWFKNEYKFVVV